MNAALLILIAFLSYNLGSINAAGLAGRYVYHKDVRKLVRNGASLSEYRKRFGLSGAVLIVLIDVAKTMVAVLLGGLLLGTVEAALIGRLFAGFCVVLGSGCSVFHGFRGGKGLLCFCIMALMVDWRVGVCCILAFVIALIFSRYLSLSAIIAVLLSPMMMWVFGHDTLPGLLVLFSALVVIFKHGENILRLIGGTEPRVKFGTQNRAGNDDADDGNFF